MSDQDQSGKGFQKVRAWLGPSLGWSEDSVIPETHIEQAGTYVVQPGDQWLLVDVAAAVTIQLPDVVEWINQRANQPATGFSRSITVKDIGANASNFPITIKPFGLQAIDDLAQSITISVSRATLTLVPLYDFSGWAVEASFMGAVPPGGGDVFKAGDNTFTGTNTFNGTTTAPNQSPSDDSQKLATTHWVKQQNYLTTVSLAPYALLDSPAFINTPTAPTPVATDNSTRIATTAFIKGLLTSAGYGDVFSTGGPAADSLAQWSGAGGHTIKGLPIGPTLTTAGGILNTAAGGGNVQTSGSPASPQLAQFTNASQIQGINVGTGLVLSPGTLGVDGDLAALSQLTGTNNIYYRNGTDSWGAVVIGANLSFSGGTLAVSLPITVPLMTVSDTAPGAPKQGDLWWESDSGTLYMWYVDANSSQWVSVGGSAVGAPADSPVFTGDPRAPTPALSDNDTSIATTAFVKGQGYVTGGPYLPTAGGTLTGNLAIGLANPNFILNKSASGGANFIIGQTNGSARWRMQLGNITSETGGAVGSDFSIQACDDTGTPVLTPMTIVRSSGAVAIRGTQTNDDAATGQVGEYVEALFQGSTAVTPSTITNATNTASPLGAGDWDIGARLMVQTASGALVEMEVGTVNAGMSGTPQRYFSQSCGAGNFVIVMENVRMKLASASTVYLTTRSGTAFTIIQGILKCRRAR